MKIFGLIGYPLGHSFSRQYFNSKFRKERLDCIYRNFEIKDLAEFPPLLKNENILGLNVTIPYKNDILKHCDWISDEVKEIGATNTILIEDSKLKAFNTDYLGFLGSLEDIPLDDKKTALILGSGGSSKAVRFALESKGIKCIVVSRNPEKGQIGYEQMSKEIMEDTTIIINCTPLGMHPNVQSIPNIPYDLINENHFCYDLVYNPEMTVFLKKCEAKGAGIKNGLEMLILQAEAAWDIWKKHI